MIPEYIKKWLQLIEKMSNFNTYKLAWGRSIIEAVECNDYEKLDDNTDQISMDKISLNVLRYYWNQTYFFNLKQCGSYSKATIMTSVNSLITKYQDLTENTFPVWFDEALVEIKKKDLSFFNKTIKDISRCLIANPYRYFVHLEKDKYLDIYSLSNDKKYLLLKHEDLLALNEYGFILSELLNYRWSQLLENYNAAPKINQKVNRISENKIRRASLKHFIKFLMEATDNKPIDFYTGVELAKDNISVDHVIPWSFMYSDDIWNLVLTSKKNNSSKNNKIPTKEQIELLKERNNKLLNIIDDDKMKEELNTAVDNQYVDKYYMSCRYDFKV